MMIAQENVSKGGAKTSIHSQLAVLHVLINTVRYRGMKKFGQNFC